MRDGGLYESYITSLTEAGIIFGAKQISEKEDIDKFKNNYCDSVGQIYCNLIYEMNIALNKLIGTDLQSEDNKLTETLDQIDFFAKDALMRGNTELAEKYILEVKYG